MRNIDKRDIEIRHLKRELKKAKEDKKIKKVGLIMQLVTAITSIISLLKELGGYIAPNLYGDIYFIIF